MLSHFLEVTGLADYVVVFLLLDEPRIASMDALLAKTTKEEAQKTDVG